MGCPNTTHTLTQGICTSCLKDLLSMTSKSKLLVEVTDYDNQRFSGIIVGFSFQEELHLILQRLDGHIMSVRPWRIVVFADQSGVRLYDIRVGRGVLTNG